MGTHRTLTSQGSSSFVSPHGKSDKVRMGAKIVNLLYLTQSNLYLSINWWKKEKNRDKLKLRQMERGPCFFGFVYR